MRSEELAVASTFRDIDEYVAISADTSGPMALVLQGLSEAERAKVTETLAAAPAPVPNRTGYEVPGVTVVAVAA